MRSNSSIYWVDLDFINNYKECKLTRSFMGVSANLASTFLELLLMVSKPTKYPIVVWPHRQL